MGAEPVAVTGVSDALSVSARRGAGAVLEKAREDLGAIVPHRMRDGFDRQVTAAEELFGPLLPQSREVIAYRSAGNPGEHLAEIASFEADMTGNVHATDAMCEVIDHELTCTLDVLPQIVVRGPGAYRLHGWSSLDQMHKEPRKKCIRLEVLCLPGVGLECHGWGILPHEIDSEWRPAWATWCLAYAAGERSREEAFKRFDRMRYPLGTHDRYVQANTWGSSQGWLEHRQAAEQIGRAHV